VEKFIKKRIGMRGLKACNTKQAVTGMERRNTWKRTIWSRQNGIARDEGCVDVSKS